MRLAAEGKAVMDWSVRLESRPFLTDSGGLPEMSQAIRGKEDDVKTEVLVL